MPLCPFCIPARNFRMFYREPALSACPAERRRTPGESRSCWSSRCCWRVAELRARMKQLLTSSRRGFGRRASVFTCTALAMIALGSQLSAAEAGKTQHLANAEAVPGGTGG